MNRKKVAVLLPWLKMGGTNKIALNFMQELSQYCDVTLILSENSGELLRDIPEKAELIIDDMEDLRQIVKKDIHRLRISWLLKDVLYYIKIKTGRDSDDNYKYIVDRHGYITDEVYDCAISYHGQSPERLLNLLYRIHARKKVVWIHGEMSFSPDRINGLKKYYNQIDHFFFVSSHTRDSFRRIIPFDLQKSTVYFNPINKDEIIRKSNEQIPDRFSHDYINLLTVGRLSKEKGQDMVPAVTRKLLDHDWRVRWYLIGDGNLRTEVERLIIENGVEGNVILLGTKTNPYPFMRDCDIYVQPSYTEGYSTTICEAGILGKAIVGTKPSGGIADQISDGEDGLIVDATVEGLANGISQLIMNKSLRRQFEDKICKRNYEGKGEIQKFLRFLENSKRNQ